MNTYKMKLEDSVDSMIFDLLEVPIVDKDVEGAVDNTTVDGNVFTDYLWLKKNYVQKWSIMCDDEYSQLRGFYTRQFDNASVPTYKLYTGQNLSEDFIASGKYIMVNNTTDYNAPINSFELLGDAEQTTYSGKNLFTMNGVTNPQYPASGITIDKTDNTLTITSATTVGAQYYGTTLPYGTFDATKTYTMSGKATKVVKGTAGAPAVCVRWRGSNDGGTTWTAYDDIYRNSNPTQGTAYEWSGTLTGYTSYQFFFYGNTGGTVSTGEKTSYTDLQLELGSTATSYEPYVGGTASPNPDYPQAVNVVTGEQTVKIEGKNLIDNSQFVKGRTDNGVIGYASGTTDLSYTANSISFTTNASYRGVVSGLIQVQPNMTYTFTATTTDTISRYIDAYDETGAWISRITGLSGLDFTATTPANCYGIRISFQLPSAGTGTLINPQLELGSQASDYTPYQGQEFEVNLGKNLYSDSWENGGISASSGANNSDANIRTVNYISVNAGTTYTASCDTGTRIALRYYNSAGTYLSAGTTSSSNINTFTTPTNTARVRFVIIGASGTSPNFQLEKGSQATSYSAYFEPIELAKIGTYQDRIYKSEGKWYVEKQVGKVVLDGTESWGSYATDGVQANYLNIADCYMATTSSTQFIGLSDYYTPTSQADIYANDINGISFRRNVSGIIIKNLATASVSDFKTWLASNPTTVYYALATPTTTEITNSALVGQLNAIQNASLYTGINNISNNAVSPNLAGDLDLGYTLIYEKENIIIPQTSVRLTLTDGGVINVCGCRQNVQLGMRETIQ